MYRGQGGPAGGGGRGGFPARGGYGRGGGGGGGGYHGGPALPRPGSKEIVQVQTNCFQIRELPKKEYYQYEVTITPPIKPFSKRQELLHKLQHTVQPRFFTPKCIYDGNVILFSSRNLGVTAFLDFQVNISDRAVPDQAQAQTQAQGARPPRGLYTVRISATAAEPVRPSHLKKLISGKASTLASGLEASQAATATNLLQLLVRQAPNQNNIHNARAYFSELGKMEIGGGLELWRGFFQSVRPVMDKMVVNVDTTMATVYKGGSVINVACSFLNTSNVRDLEFRSGQSGRGGEVDFNRLKNFLKNLKVYVNTGRKRIKTIRGLVRNVGGYVFANGDSGERMTVQDYLLRTYNIRLNYPTIVGLVLSPPNVPEKERVVVPMEVCEIKEGQMYKQRVPDELTKQVVEFATLKPGDRLAALKGENRKYKVESPVLGYAHSEYLLEAGMSITTEPLKIAGRFLELPKVQFQSTEANIEKGAWNLRDHRLCKPGKLSCWALVTFDNKTRGLLTQIANGVMKACNRLGMEVENPLATTIANEQAYERELDTVRNLLMSTLSRLGSGHIPILVIVLPEKNNGTLRQYVKWWSDVHAGIPTQCMRGGQKQEKGGAQYYENVALKINLRLSGINFVVQSPAIEHFGSKPFMVIGADVGHPSPGSIRPSVASIVYSCDKHATQYSAISGIQDPRQEGISDMRRMVYRAVDSWGAMNRTIPQRILVFRDGLSEGELSGVAEWEIGEIRGSIEDVWRDRRVQAPFPKLTYIVVGKRHHITFFPSRGSAASDHNGNCIAGFATSDLKHPLTEDFYLQSHAAIQGTARSSHYTVIKDEIFDGNVDLIQNLAFALCHSYSKATRSVSIPTPVYYADLVCSRFLYHLHPHSELHHSDGVSSIGQDKEQGFDMDKWREAFKPLHDNMTKNMYFL
ncbi:Piwi-domain-containing protein [Dendrothele bispora CBS 962.96]|uniref:Piwi-domain-containing protein n=1 Tax=Dendrothele bispora (strain CBS 962.96) TaxID=1314807 RepID=A0A4V4HBN5_DENBC|nr:Piwi-domain-containing protein [Dendrothele bispora CBS 962.96]